MGTEGISGGLTAETFKVIVTISTSGFLRLCGVITEDATSRTIGLKITMDGAVVFNEISPAIAADNKGFFAVGFNFAGSSSMLSLESIRFNASLVLAISSSITETDKIALKYLTVV